MRILLDARYLSSLHSGIGRYSQCLVENLARLDSENEFQVVVHESFRGRLELADNFQIVRRTALPVSLRSLLPAPRAFRRQKYDIWHSFFPLAPLTLSTPLLVTLHDLQPFWDPDFHGRRPRPIRWAYEKFYRIIYPATLRLARWIIVNSEATRMGLREFFPDVVDKAIVVPLGLSESSRQLPDEEEIERVKRRYKIAWPFLLYYGSTRPNKNLPRLVEAFAMMRHEHPEAEDTRLVLAVAADRFFADVQARIRLEKIQEYVQILQPVSESERKALLRLARVFCFPSRYEGFGFPVLEAQAMRTPVLASRAAPCLRRAAMALCMLILSIRKQWPKVCGACCRMNRCATA